MCSLYQPSRQLCIATTLHKLVRTYLWTTTAVGRASWYQTVHTAIAHTVVMGFDESLPVADRHRPGHQQRSWRRALCIKLTLTLGAVCAVHAISKWRYTAVRASRYRAISPESAGPAIDPDFDWFSVRVHLHCIHLLCAHCTFSSRHLKTYNGRHASTTSPCALVSSCPSTTSLRPAMDRMPPLQCNCYLQKTRLTSGAPSS